jgi:hypothetical protein
LKWVGTEWHAACFSDGQITVATQVIGYFNYINRVAEGLGVDHESWMDVPQDEWRRGKESDSHPHFF